MKVITCWHDLREYGIDLLTGEACNLGKRYLFDLTERGKRLICEVLGLPSDCKLQESWNSGDPGDRHIASIFLPPVMFTIIAAMALLRRGCRCAVVAENGNVYGIEDNDDLMTVDENCETTREIEIEDPDEPGQRITVLKKIKGTVTDPLGKLRQFYKIAEVYGSMEGHPHRGFSNVHAMSGRAQ